MKQVLMSNVVLVHHLRDNLKCGWTSLLRFLPTTKLRKGLLRGNSVRLTTALGMFYTNYVIQILSHLRRKNLTDSWRRVQQTLQIFYTIADNLTIGTCLRLIIITENELKKTEGLRTRSTFSQEGCWQIYRQWHDKRQIKEFSMLRTMKNLSCTV